jgi:hypothetical protein
MVAKKLVPLTLRLLCWLSALSLPVALLAGSLNGDPAPSARAAGLSETSLSKKIYVDINRTSGNHTGVSWANAYQSLQPALDEALPGDQVWVATGVYTPTHRTVDVNPRSATFRLAPGVALYGSFKGDETSLNQRNWRLHPSILSGDLTGNDSGFAYNDENSYHVVTSEHVTETARLDGFIIQGGNASSGSNPDYFGGGLYNSSGSPSLVNLIFYQNRAEQSGGGLYNIDSNSLLVNVAWIGNSAFWGGGLKNLNSNPRLVNTLFVGNNADVSGGAIYNSGSSPSFTNCTVAYNSTSDRGGGILNDQNINHNTTDLELFNCILWGNTLATGPDQIYNEPTPASTTELNHTLIQGGWMITGTTCVDTCLTADPLFVDPPGLDGFIGTLDDNLRLSASSPAINAGDNSLVPQDLLDINYNGIITEALPFDLDNTSRILGLIDPGAYELKIPLYLPVIRK